MIEKLDHVLKDATGVNRIRLQRIRTKLSLNVHLSVSDKAVLKFNGV